MIIRKLEHLTPYYDEEGTRWYALREVCQLVKESNTRKASRHIEQGCRRRIIEKGADWRFQRHVHLIDGVALVEICRALSTVPNRDVRTYAAVRLG